MKLNLKAKKNLCSLLIILFILTGCSQQTPIINDNLSIELDNYVNAFNESYNSHQINGSIIISKGGKVVANRSYGMADYTGSIPFTENTKTMICSTTKIFTGIAIMQLKEKGLLSLDDKVSKYAPKQVKGEDITIRQLLTHTSGIIRDITDTGFINPYENVPKEKLVALVNERPLLFEPGTKMSYSNAGYQLLSSIIEDTSGLSFEEYVTIHILKPSGMKDTGMSFSKDDVIDIAVGYEYKHGKYIKKESYDMSHTYGSGNVYSTAYDMYLFDKALREGKIIKKETLEEMIVDNTGLDFNYGYGCYIGNFKDHRWFGHPGNLNSGRFSYYLRFPNEDISITILFNTTWNDNNSIMKAISAIALGEDYKMPYKKNEIKLDKKKLDKFIGEYEPTGNGSIGKITIEKENDHLIISSAGQDIYLTPYSETSFFDKQNEMWEHIFETDGSGKIIYYILKDPVEKMRFRKKN